MAGVTIGPRGGGGGGGGGGNANIGILLRQAGEDDKGIFVSHRSGDLTWHAQAEARRDAEAAAAAALTFVNEDQDAQLDVTLPLDWAAPPETQNARDILYVRYPNPFAGATADALYGALRIAATGVGAGPNRNRYQAEAGTAAVAAVNAHADIEGSRGATPGHNGVIRVRSPGLARIATAQVRGTTNTNTVLLTYYRAGGQGIRIQFRWVTTGSLGDVSAAWNAGGTILTVSMTTGVSFTNIGVDDIIAAINAARFNSEQTITASRISGTGGVNTLFRGHQGTDHSGARYNYTLTGGGEAIPGAVTNTGGVNVVSSGARVAGTAATYVWQIANGRQITLTFHETGVAGNNLQFTTREDTTNLNGNSVRVSDSGADFLLRYNGTISLGTIVDAINGTRLHGVQRFVATITQGSRADNVTPSGNNTWRTSGGVDEVNPLAAAWDAASHTLTVTALADDTFDEVMDEIATLSEFQRTRGGNAVDGSMPGDIWLADAALATDTIDVDATVGETLSAAFTGGTDAVARTPLNVRQNYRTQNEVRVYTLTIEGVINTDTVQDAIDAYAGASDKQFVLSAASGRQATDALSGSDVPATNLTGGQDAVPRLPPEVTMADDGRIGISLHAQNGRADNTTLAELEAAFDAATYVDTEGNTHTFAGASLDVSGGGAGTDPIRNQALPVRPTGGRNEVLANITEAEARPDDDVDGPNILLKYDDADDLDTLIAGFAANNNGGFTFTLVYGTDGTANPESTPFTRSFYDGGLAEAPSTGTGGLTEGQVDGRIRALAKGYALKGGPDVPDSEIGDEIARDTEIKDYARVGGGQVLLDDIPDAIARDAEIDPHIKPYARTGGPVVPESDIDPAIARDIEIKPYALRGGGTVYDSDIPASIARDSEVDSIRHNLSLKDVRNIVRNTNGTLEIELNDGTTFTTGKDLKSVRDQGNYSDGTTYSERDLVTHTHAGSTGWYLAKRSDFSGIEPRVTANWTNWWDFLCWRDGAPGSVVDVDFDADNGELVSRTRGGTTNRKAIPTGGTTVAANPAGTGGDEITRIAIAGVDYNLPNPTIPEIGRTERIAFQDEDNVPTGTAAELTPATTDPISVVAGDGAASLLSGVSGNDFMVKAGLYFLSYEGEARAAGANASVQFEVRQASDNAVLATTSVSYLGRTSDGWIAVSKTKLLALAQDTLVNVAAHSVRETTDVRNMAVAFTEMFASATADSGVTPSPSISSYTLRTGEQHPVAGSIAGDRYQLDWQIAQADHVGSARILGFKEAYGDGTGAAVLDNISPGASVPGHPNVGWANGQGSVLIPQGVSLADGEHYTLRLQVFAEGVTNPALTATPAAYQDIVIVAHAPATAAYHWGRLPRVANKTAAQYAADIVFGTTGAGTDLVTGNALDTTNGYDAVPDSTGNWIFYLTARADEQQPSGWTTGGLAASAVFQSAVTQAFNSVDYSVYVMQDLYYRTDADGSQNYTPTVS